MTRTDTREQVQLCLRDRIAIAALLFTVSSSMGGCMWRVSDRLTRMETHIESLTRDIDRLFQDRTHARTDR